VQRKLSAKYDASTRGIQNEYRGFTIPREHNSNAMPPQSTTWTPQRLDHVPSKQEFGEFVRRREPFIIAVPDAIGIDSASSSLLPCSKLVRELGWPGLCESGATSETTLCQLAPSNASVALATSGGVDGATTTSRGTTAREDVPFCDFVRWLFGNSHEAGMSQKQYFFDAASTKDWETPHRSGDSRRTSADPIVAKYDFPLNLLANRMPLPKFMAAGTCVCGGWSGVEVLRPLWPGSHAHGACC